MMKVKEPPAAYESVNYWPADCRRPEDTYGDEYKEFNSYFQQAVKNTRQKLLAAGCKSAAKRLRKHMEQFNTGIASMRLLGVDWIGIMDSLLEQYCRDAIMNQIKNTPMTDRSKWTADILDTKIDTCGLDEAARVEIYKMAGLDPREQAARIAKYRLQHTEPAHYTESVLYAEPTDIPCYRKAMSG